MAGNSALLWGSLLRLIASWVLRQLLGLLAIGGSLVLLAGLANVVEGLDARLTGLETTFQGVTRGTGIHGDTIFFGTTIKVTNLLFNGTIGYDP